MTKETQSPLWQSGGMGGGGGARGLPEGGEIYTPMTDSCWRMAKAAL